MMEVTEDDAGIAQIRLYESDDPEVWSGDLYISNDKIEYECGDCAYDLCIDLTDDIKQKIIQALSR